MTANNLWNQCLIGSLLFHIGLFILIKNVSQSPLVAMSAVDAFIVESLEVKNPGPIRSIAPDSHKILSSPTREGSSLQPVHREALSSSPYADQNAEVIKIAPSQETTDASVSRPVQITAPASALPDSGAVNSPARSQDDTSGNKASGASHQSQATSRVMMLGDAGAARFIHRELPQYPYLARKLGKEGKVVLRLALDAQGKLQRIDTVDSNGFGFADAASVAMRKSTFEPAVKNGSAIASLVLVPVRFVLKEVQ